jgi:acetate kinase
MIAQGGDLGAISTDDSRATVRAIRTDEELMIARSV